VQLRAKTSDLLMKSLITILAVVVAFAFTVPAFAGDVAAAKTEADCKSSPRKITPSEKKYCAEACHKFCGDTDF
jgi:hypothetical protein